MQVNLIELSISHLSNIICLMVLLQPMDSVFYFRQRKKEMICESMSSHCIDDIYNLKSEI